MGTALYETYVAGLRNLDVYSMTPLDYKYFYLTVFAATSGNLVIQVQHGFSFKKIG